MIADDTVERLTKRYDYHDPAFTPAVAEVVNTRLRDAPEDVVFSAAHGGMWIVTSYDLVREVQRDHATFSSGSGVFYPRAAGMPKFSPIDHDPPEHGFLRRLMAPPLGRAEVARLRADVARMTAQLVEPVVERGRGDLTAECATPLAIGALSLAIGLPEKTQGAVRELTSTLWAHLSRDPDCDRFWPAFRELLEEEIAEHRRRPDGSYLSHLVNDDVDGQRLDEPTLLSIMVSYCIAGHETTMNTISRMLWWFAGHPDLQDRVRAEPGLATVAGDETLRRWCPTDRFTRVTTREVALGGVTVPAGARVVLLLDAANRDPRRFPHPDTFSLDRGNSHQHLSFGHGIHHCAGVHLARLELEAVLLELARHPNYSLVAEPALHFENGRHIVFDGVPIVFAPSPRSALGGIR